LEGTELIQWAYFPRNERIPEFCESVRQCFVEAARDIDSEAYNDKISTSFKDAASNQVLARVRPGLGALGFVVEAGKATAEKVSVPVLFGKNGKPAKLFEADAYHAGYRLVVEIEAGRAVTNYQFRKDLFQACVMVDVDYLCIAVRNIYKTSADFDKVCTFLDTLYTSGRLRLPLKGILIVGY
jgi:hypothetical protein